MGFLTFIGKVREYQRQAEEDRDAVAQAIDYCISAAILPEFFRKHREEIMNTTVLDLTYERQLELIKEDYKDEVAQLRKQLQEYESKQQSSEATIHALQKERAELEKERAELEKERAELEKERAELEKEIAELRKKDGIHS